MPDFEEDEHTRRQRGWQRRHDPRERDDAYDDDADEFDDYDDLPTYQTPPESRVRGPGMGMFVMGLIHTLLLWAGVVVCAVLLATNDGPPRQRNEDATVFILIGIACAVSSIFFMLIAYGGWQMSRCRSYGMSMTAAILCIGTFLCMGLSSVLIMPFGIWALVVLSDNRVKQAFRGPLRSRRNTNEDWDE